ncbi:MAG: hypothetical protein KC422_03345 [Trueperaceae bacterium]|nr:hypothetical protein [Trueperaceae bacterium]
MAEKASFKKDGFKSPRFLRYHQSSALQTANSNTTENSGKPGFQAISHRKGGQENVCGDSLSLSFEVRR